MNLTSVLAAAIAAAAQSPSMPAWLEGCWEQRSAERWTEECWSAPRGGMMIGYSRTGEGGVLTGWEVMQIVLEETDDPAAVKLAFWAAPSGQGRTMFAWTPSTQPGVSFFNMENDYPQRIRYWREGRELHAEISLADGSKPQRWRFARLRTPPSPRAR
jgi:hypothetical protein